MFGEHYVYLRIRGHGDDHTAIGIQAHDLRITSRADILSQPFPEHVSLGEGPAAVVAGDFSQERTNSRDGAHQEVLPRIFPGDATLDWSKIEASPDGLNLLSRAIQQFDLIELHTDEPASISLLELAVDARSRGDDHPIADCIGIFHDRYHRCLHGT